MQVTDRVESAAARLPASFQTPDGPAARAVRLTRDVGEAFEALFGPWETQLEASLRRLAALQARLDAQARRLRGLESELASLAPAGAAWSPPAS
jgi:hypothetical protein